MHTYHKPSHNKCPILTAGLLLSLLSLSPVALSDDIEVYLQEPADPVPPNILFVLDESGSMAENTPTRRDVLVDALSSVFRDDSMAHVNAALLGYSSRGLYAHAGDFKVIDEGTNQQTFLDEIDELANRGSTPTVYTLDHAVDWFKPGTAFRAILDSEYNADTESTTYTTIDLTSPFEHEGVSAESMRCASNHIVLLSDGAPNTNTYTEYDGTACATDNLLFSAGRLSPEPGDLCAYEIASWANNHDLMESEGWDGIQNITINTVGFYTSGDTRTFLENVASAGGGTYYHSDAGTLVSDLAEIVTNAQHNIDYAFNAPIVPFNPDNAAVSGEHIYVPIFVPEVELFWKGNIKKYRISVTDDEIAIVDADGNALLDSEFNFEDRRDYWSTQTDDGNPLIGGAAQKMTSSGNRMLFTNIDSSVPLSNTSNRVVNENEDITMAMLGVTTAEERTSLLDWVSWDPDVPTDESHEGEMGAPIHTKPSVVNYSGGAVVYIPTSEGVLEAIDANDGTELWAFMPQDLLTNISRIKQNESSTIPYYGLDGPLTIYETSGGSTMAIVGMRRGGEKYYLLDISNRTAPELVSIISSDQNDFSKLGQTWSKPMFVKMTLDDNEREVLVFGGGYDTDQDTATTRSADDVGNVIYIVDASDGSLLKSISNSGATLNISGMTNAIASDIMTLDIDGDALVDRLYAADVGGRIIRVDIDPLTGGVIADVNNGSGVASDFFRFFSSPQVGYFSKGGRQFLAILIGSGNRTAPITATIRDRFFMIKDLDVFSAPASYTEVAGNQLLNATTNTLTATNVLDTANKGWYIEFSASEKSYSKAILWDYSVIFTTYSANVVTPDDPCEAVGEVGTARIHAVDLITTNAAIDWSGNGETDLTITDRTAQLEMPGIPPSPMLIFPGAEDAEGNTVLGKKVFLFSDLTKKHEWADRFRPVYWEEVIDDEVVTDEGT